MSPDRRSMLKALAGGAAVVAGGVVGWQVLSDDGSEPTTADTLPPRGPLTPAAVALVPVGTRYLEQHPEEADLEVLLGLLPPLRGEVPDQPDRDLGVLADQVAADHDAGEVVALDGWILSRTECRAAALYAV